MSPLEPTFPNQSAKHRGQPLLRPENVIRHLLDDATVVIPQGVILGYSSRLHPLLRGRGFHNFRGYSSPWHSMWLPANSTHPRVGVVEGFGFGAPGAAIVMEELVALGVRRFVNIGFAGALPNEVDFGDVVLCSGAIRDEGVSHHYVAPARYAYPSLALTQGVREVLQRKGEPFSEGASWTLDAIYRETLEEALIYRDEGVVTVEMEASALFTIAEVRGVEIASLFAISDHLLAAPQWRPAPNKELLSGGLARILDVALEVLSPDETFEVGPHDHGDDEIESPFA